MGNGSIFVKAAQVYKADEDTVDSVLAKNVIICSKSAAINILVYNNSVRDKKNLAYEEENLKFLKITDYKIWTYADYAERVLDSITHKPAVSAQCTTGVISRLSDDFPNPIPFICFGGTISLYEVIADLSSVIHSTSHTLKGNLMGTSGMGMLHLYHTLRSFGLIPFIVDYMKKYNSGLLVTGHSIGGAVSLLFVSELLIDYPELFDANPVHLITFGSPRVFTPSSAAMIHDLMKAKPNLNFIRIVNRRDIISMLPSSNSRSLVHIGAAYYLGKQSIEVFTGEIHVNFPLDKEGMMHRVAQFVNSKAVFHRMDPPMCGYLPRLIQLSFNQMNINLDETRELSSLLQSVGEKERYRLFKMNEKSNLKNPLALKPAASIDCKIWTDISNPKFSYPEMLLDTMNRKIDFGIALGGGGLSASCFVLGWLRALHRLGALSMAGYVSSVGSASWVHIPMSYSIKNPPADLEEFLGQYVPPSSCTAEAVEQSVSRGHGKVLSESDVLKGYVAEHAKHFSHLYHHSRTVNAWSEIVGNKFLKPHGFKIQSTGIPSLDGDAKVRMKTLTSGWVDDLYVARPLKEHPFPIVNGSVFVGSSRGCLPVEFTPLYFGIIPYYEDPNMGIGGCLIEPHGFTATPDPLDLRLQMFESSSSKSGGHHTPGKVARQNSLVANESTDFCSLIQVPKPDFTVNLHEIAGISSSNAFTTHNFSVLPTFTPLFKGDNISSREHFQDGGCCDSTGIIALLRRRCTSIIACITSTARLEYSESIADANLHSLGHLAGLFGRQVSDKRVGLVKSDSYNEQRKVFPSEAWDELRTALLSKSRGLE